MAEPVSASDGLPDPPEFMNDDGTPATWVEQLPKHARRKAFALRFGISLAIAAVIWALQYINNVPSEMYSTVFLLPIIGAGAGINAYRRTTLRRFASQGASVPHRTRLVRAFFWVLWSTVAVLSVSLAVSFRDASAAFWWNAGCVVIVAIPGIMLYTWKREAPLTPKAAVAKIYYERLAKQPTETLAEKADSFIDKLIAKPAVHYPIVAAFLWGAYYNAFESTAKDSGWLAVACVVLAGVFAREMHQWILRIVGWIFGAGLWVLGLGLVALIGSALFAGVAALPVSVAVIIGALIIAGAVNR